MWSSISKALVSDIRLSRCEKYLALKIPFIHGNKTLIAFKYLLLSGFRLMFYVLNNDRFDKGANK